MGGHDKLEWKGVEGARERSRRGMMMKRRERGKVEAEAEICWDSIKACMKGGRRGEE